MAMELLEALLHNQIRSTLGHAQSKGLPQIAGNSREKRNRAENHRLRSCRENGGGSMKTSHSVMADNAKLKETLDDIARSLSRYGKHLDHCYGGTCHICVTIRKAKAVLREVNHE
jgi:hypothetical protein